MKTWLISISVATALISSGTQAAGEAAAGDATAGKAKVAACTACHGPNGNALVPTWPKLAGQHAQYIYKQLMDFKSGARANAQMGPQMIPLSEQDFRDIAAYYSTQQQTPGTTDPAAAELGERIYRGGNPATGVTACTGCHGPAGAGLGAAKFPRVAGQHAQYLDSTLKGFRTGARANDPNGMMRDVASRMSDEEIAAVSQFIQGLTDWPPDSP
ncbi:c-type cytochrome [Candidatus Thiosymbion oneisti]|uniref:c-type cytochrome n=1 Tax=Candidatus Thiosymbion oneisti TaxID=589554 RepID=UPI000A551B33|nr:c-type cytochrome [Candidatus Thiosymbion oneisti]